MNVKKGTTKNMTILP